MANKVVVEIDVQTGDASKKIDQAEAGVKDLKKESQSASKSFGSLGSAADKATGGIISGAKGAVGAVRGLVTGFKTLKFAIAATGIGLIVIAVTAVISAVSRLQGVMDKFKQFTAGLSIIMDILGDTLAYIGEALINAFTSPQEALESVSNGIESIFNWMQQLNAVIVGKIMGVLLGLKRNFLEVAIATKEFFGGDATELKKSLDETKQKIEAVDKAVEDATENVKQPFVDAAEAVGEFATRLKDAALAAAELEKAEQSLEDRRIDQIATQAERNKLIAESRLIAEDETKSYLKREQALRRAIELEKQNLAERKANAEEELRIIVAQNEQAESGREDRKAEAEAKARVFELEEQSAKQQKRIFTELQTLSNQRNAESKKALEDQAKARAEMMALIEEDVYAEEEAMIDEMLEHQKNSDLEGVNSYAEAQAEKIRITQEANAILDAEQQRQNEESERLRQKELSDEQALQNAKKNLAKVAFGAIQDIAEMVGQDDEKRARKAFAVTKSLNTAQAIMSTYGSVNTILKDETLPTTAKPFAIAAAVSTGLLNVAKIQRTKFKGSSASKGSTPSLAGGGASATTTPTLDTSALNTEPQQNIQAYVLDKTITQTQAQNQKIEEQANLVL